MTIRKGALLTTLAALIAVFIFAWAARDRWTAEEAAGREAQRAAAQTLTRVAMKWTFAGTMAPYFAAQRNGLFERHNLKVELLPGGPQLPSSVQQVLFNKADFGITGAHELALARSNDQPVVSVAVIFKTSPVCLASVADARIRRPSDLRGRTVEMTVGDNAEFEYLAMLTANGIDPTSVKQVRWLFNYDRLLQGSTDAAVVYANDQAITLRKKRDIALLCPSDFGITPYADVLFTTERTIAERPDWVGSVVAAFLESWEESLRNPKGTVDMFLSAPEIKNLNLDPDDQLAVLDMSVRYVRGTNSQAPVANHIPGLGLQERERWEETMALLRVYANVPKIPSAEGAFTNQWAHLHEMLSKKPTS